MAGKLLQSFAHFQQITAALHKGVDLGENGAFWTVPRKLGISGDQATHLLISLPPLVATLNRLTKLNHRGLDPTCENVLKFDRRLTATDDFVAHFPQENGDSISLPVVCGD